MKTFMGRDFLLDTKTALRLYEMHAAKLPIIDIHSNIVPSEIAEDKYFSNITELWIYSDNFKRNAMRACGVEERYITGDASDYEKFSEYCRIMPLLIGNPIYHRSHLELVRYFDCDIIINSQNAEAIWTVTSDKILRNSWGIRDYIIKSNVKLLCTLDDPKDDLHFHREIRESDFDVQVLPIFCPEMGLNIDKMGIAEYIRSLGVSTGIQIQDYDSLCKAYIIALDRFDNMGCRSADHKMNDYIKFCKPDIYHADSIFKKALLSNGAEVTTDELFLWKTQMMRFLGAEYVKRGWVLQLHSGFSDNEDKSNIWFASRHNNEYEKNCISAVVDLLKYMQENKVLPRTIVYPINQIDNIDAETICSNFCCGDGSDAPDIVQGSKLWNNDSVEVIESRIKSFASSASLGNHFGTITNSKGLSYYIQYECFRRLLCNIIGGWVEKGLYSDYDSAANIVERVLYHNVVQYFGFNIKN